MPEPAVVLAPRLYRTPNGKTAHGLVRGSDRFAVLAIVDPDCAGRDAGEVLDGVARGIPVRRSLAEALRATDTRPRYCVVGIATHGGRFTPELHADLVAAAEAGIGIVNGLHDAASEDPAIAAAAARTGAEIVDLRKPRPKSELHFWEGEILGVRTPRVAVLGTDCALGKRTTTRMLVETLREQGVAAEMIYTGQTGWMQGARYGFVLDSTLNDYVSGEMEHAVLACEREARPDVMVIEGQSSMRNPSGPCGAELLLSAGARAVVLQHAPGREFFEGYEAARLRIPPVAEEIELLRFYGARTLALTLSRQGLTPEAMRAHRDRLERDLSIPAVDVLGEGLGRVAGAVCEHLREAVA